MPKRIQRKRQKGWRMPEGAVYVGRPTKWGNPYRVGRSYAEERVENGRVIIREWTSIDAKTAVEFYREAVLGHYPSVGVTVDEIVAELRGKDLVCWCALDEPCHADVLLRLANSN